MSEKTNKSYSKRLKVTGSGKLIGRKPGVDHFNSRASRVTQLGQRRGSEFKITTKNRGRFMPNG